MKRLNNPVIVYLVVAIVSLACAAALFALGGSLAEVTGNKETALGFTFKAGGAIAGFIIIFVLSQQAISKFNEKFTEDTVESAKTYRSELQKIIYEGNFLQYVDQRFKKQAWMNLTRSLYKNNFPSLKDIENVIFEKFIPKELDYYHRDAETYYTIEESGTDYIVITENQKFVIVCDSKIHFNSKMNVYGQNIAGDQTSLEVSKFKVNGKNKMDAVKKTAPAIEKGLKKFSVEIDLHLNEKIQEYSIEIEAVTKHTRKLNVFWRRTMQRYTHSFQVGIHEGQGLDVDFIPIGHNLDFKAIGEPVVKSLKKHSGLLLPEEGYIIFVK